MTKSGRQRKAKRRSRQARMGKIAKRLTRDDVKELPRSVMWPEFSDGIVGSIESEQDAATRDRKWEQLLDRAELRELVRAARSGDSWAIPIEAKDRMVYDAIRIFLNPHTTADEKAKAMNAILSMERNNQRAELIKLKREQNGEGTQVNINLGGTIREIVEDENHRRKLDAFDIVDEETD